MRRVGGVGRTSPHRVVPLGHDGLMYTEMDHKLVALAAAQHHVFTLQQAYGIGFSERQAMHRVATGAWCRLGPGAYALPGATIDTRARLKASTLVTLGSVASHESAGELRDYPLVPRGLVVVSRPNARPNRTELGRIRRVGDFRPSDHDLIDGIPVTSALRTAADLAAVMRAGRYRTMIDRLLVRNEFTSEDLADVAVRWCRRGRKGSRLLWDTVDAQGEGYVAPESELEQAGLALLERGGFPPPIRQLALPWRSTKPGRVDCAYVGERVLIEWDSRKHHREEEQFENDRVRDAEAIAHGWLPLRYTWKMIHHREKWVWRTLRETLAQGAANSAHLPT